MVTFFLEEQPESWATLYTLEGILTSIRDGRVQVFLVGRGKEWQGLCLFSIYEPETNLRIMSIKFLSCERFFAMAQMIEKLEQVGHAMGCNVVEAVAHPTIAQYGVNKNGFAAEGVYIRKDLRVSRRN